MKFSERIKKFFHTVILKRKYYRHGSCLKCGACCTNIYIRHKNKVIQTNEEFEEIKKCDAYSFYHQIEVIDKDDFGLIFSCSWFDKDKRICKDHKKRPTICRNYPSEQIFSFGAQLQEGCGYSFEPIETFSEIFEKVNKKPSKEFEMIN